VANDYSGTGAAGSNSFRLTADGGTVSGATSVAGNPDIVLVAGANITLTGTSPNQIKISSSGGGGGSMTFTVAGIGGTPQTISNGDTLNILGSNGITTNATNTDTLTVSSTGVLGDLNSLGAPTSDGQFIVATGAGVFAYESGATARASLGLGSAATENSSTFLQVSNNLSDLNSAATARGNLGLGTIATQNANLVAITGGSITGITDLAIADGGTGESTAQAAIDALTQVSGAVAGHVLTKDGSGNATFQAASGGIAGTIAVDQIAVGTGADTIGGSSSFQFSEAAGGITMTTGLTGNDPQISMSSNTKAITLEVTTNQQLTVRGGSDTFIFDASSATGGITWPDGTTQITASPFASLTTSGTSGVATLNSGVLNIPNYATGDTVTITASAADILSVSSGAISGVDPGADRIVFWDDSAGKLTYLTAGTGLSISGTTITATGGGGLLPGGAEKDIQVYGAGDVFAGTSRFTYDDGSGGGTATMTVDEGNINVTDTKPSTGIGNVVATGVQNVLAGTKAAEAPLPDGSEILTIDQFGQTTILTGESYTLCEGSTDPTQVTGATATFIPINDGSAPIISVAIGGGGGGGLITDIIGGGAIGSGFTVAINEPFTVYILGNVVAQWGIDPGLWPGPGDGSCVAQIFGNVVVV